MANENNNKDIANSLNKYTDYTHKGKNIILDGADSINKWYAEQLNKITENEVDNTRIETGVDNEIQEDKEPNNIKEISTKVKQYNELQTNKNESRRIIKGNKIQTISETTEGNEIRNKDATLNNKLKRAKRISTIIKGTKMINNSAQRMIRTGKDISEGLNENGTTTFKGTSSRIMTKPIKKAVNKVGNKITKKTVKFTKKIGKKIGKEIISKTTNVMIKLMKLIVKLVASAVKLILSMLPQIAPILIIIVIIAAFCSFFGIGMSEDTRKNYEAYMTNVRNEYDKSTVEFYNSGKVVDGTIEGKGMINWKAPLSIVQMLNGDLTFDNAEKELLGKFKDAGLYEKIEDVTYTYEKEVETPNRDGTVTKTKVTVTETKKVVTNPSLNSYIDWCNNNFSVINNYKKKKKVKYDSHQTRFTDSEIEQIKLLYNSNSFFDLFSADFQSAYAYLNVNITDEQIKKIYDEFLQNAGKRYLMDHSNLKYDTCMEYYDCSSWVIHCLAHTGIKQIPNTGAEGIYRYHCSPISVEDRQAGDLIFLKNTYGNFPTEGIESITHIGIYMGELTINGETAEWVIDTGGNPSGVRIRKYKDGWWNGSHFYGFARLQQ